MLGELFNFTPPQIPDYQVLSHIGSGGYGEVWLVRSVTGLLRAAKVVSRKKFNDPKPFDREYKAIELYAEVCLRDARLLRVLHVGRNESGGYFYYIMELADDAHGSSPDSPISPDTYIAHTLRHELDERSFLPASEVIRLGVELSRAVQSLHDHGLIHRDIKPSNILFIGGLPKLGDVGLVTNIREAVTQVGTQGYYPPEGPGQPSADVYALGKVLYELATGQAATYFPILPDREISRTELPRWRELNEIFLKAAEPRKAIRYATAQALLNDLLLVEAGSSVRGWLRLQRQARVLQAAAGILVAIAFIALGIAYTERKITKSAREQLAKQLSLTEQAHRQLRRSNYNLAQTELEVGRHYSARKVLEEIWPGPANEGPLEWRMLYREAFGQPERVYLKAGNPIEKLIISDHGEPISALDSRGRILEWTMGSIHPKVHEKPVIGLGFYPAGSADPLWLDVEKKGTRIHLGSATEAIQAAENAVSCTGSPVFMITQTNDQTCATTYSLDGLSPIRTTHFANLDPSTRCNRISLSFDGSWIFLQRYAEGDGGFHRLERWDSRTSALAGIWSSTHAILGLAISGDTKWVATYFGTVGPPECIELATSNHVVLRDAGIEIGADSIAIEPKGQRVATGGVDGAVRIWDMPTGHLLATYWGHAPSVKALAWSADQQYLVSGDTTGQIRRWKLSGSQTPLNRIDGFWWKEWGNILLGNQSETWAGSHISGNVGVWKDFHATDPSYLLPGSFEPAGFSKDDAILWTYGTNSMVQAWETKSGKPLSTAGPVLPQVEQPLRILVDPQNLIAYGLCDHTGFVYSWDLAKNQFLCQSKDFLSDPGLFEILPSGNAIIGMAGDGSTMCWNAADLSLRWQLQGESQVRGANGLATSYDSQWVACGTGSGAVRLVDAKTGTIKRDIQSQSDPVLAITFSRDNRRMVVSHTSGIMTWCDPNAGTVDTLYRLETLGGQLKAKPLWRLMFSHGDRALMGLANGAADPSTGYVEQHGVEVLRWFAD